jgi:hypothetical protein
VASGAAAQRCVPASGKQQKKNQKKSHLSARWCVNLVVVAFYMVEGLL